MILDDPSFLRRFDRSNFLGSIERLHLQCEQAWQETRALRIPASYRSIRQVVFSGMGGSALGGHIIQSLFSRQLPWPVTVVNDYTLPRFVGRETLLLLSSYSGSTEETLAAAHEGRKRKAKLLGITTGGALGRFFQTHRLPVYAFDPVHNPCGMPRMGLGYSVIGQLGLLRHIATTAFDVSMTSVFQRIENDQSRFGAAVPFRHNVAKQLAVAFQGHIPVLIGPTFLAGNLHTFSNQLNEGSKSFSAWHCIPELNHHLLEGLQHPPLNRQALHPVFIESHCVPPRIAKRFRVTKTIIKKHRMSFSTYVLTGRTEIEQSFELLLLGSYVNFYLAMLEHVDPAPIPYVDYLKRQLAHR